MVVKKMTQRCMPEKICSRRPSIFHCVSLERVLRIVLLFVLWLSGLDRARAGVQPLAALPSGLTATQVQLDAAGNIYVAGSVVPQNQKSAQDLTDAFAAKLSPYGSQVIYWTVFGSSWPDVANSIAVGSDGSAYVTGTAQATDFPTTSGAASTTASQGLQAFVVKLDAKGAIKYSTVFPDSLGNGIAVDSAGNAYVTGTTYTTKFPATPGSIAGAIATRGNANGFILKLDPAGSTLLSILGFGGSQIALDAQGNIFAAGSLSYPVPATPGAFQSSVMVNGCFESRILYVPCGYQHVAKIDPTGTQLLYGTYIAGGYGSNPSGLAVDSDGNVILAGNTNSPDYPTTRNAYQPRYLFEPGQELSHLLPRSHPSRPGTSPS